MRRKNFRTGCEGLATNAVNGTGGEWQRQQDNTQSKVFLAQWHNNSGEHMAQINPIFSVPFAFDQLEDCASVNQALRELFIRREAMGSRFANPQPYTPRNKALFESHFDLFNWPEACVAQLREFCLSRLLGVVAEINGYDNAKAARLNFTTDAWFHITRRGGFFGVHNHPMASWSGVYCVSAGEHDPDQPDSGKLSFINPMAQMYLDAGNSFQKFPFQYGNYAIALKPGQLVLFPSWVQHQVMPFFGEGERITVAMNCAITLR